MKHTPGPWRISRPSVANGVQIFKDYDGPRMHADVICTMPRAGKGRTANARLIAAAPAMFKALTLPPILPDDIATDDGCRAYAEAVIEWLDGPCAAAIALATT